MALVLDNHLVVSRLLIGLTKDVDVPAGFVGSVRSVVASAVLAQLADLLDLLWQELNLLEVIADAGRGNRLGDNTMATDLGPGKTEKTVSDNSTIGIKWVIQLT